MNGNCPFTRKKFFSTPEQFSDTTDGALKKITDQWIKLLDLKTQHFRIAECVSLSTSSVLIGA